MIKLVVCSVLFIISLVIFVGSLWIAIEIAYTPPETHDGCPYFDVAWPRECYIECFRKESEE